VSVAEDVGVGLVVSIDDDTSLLGDVVADAVDSLAIVVGAAVVVVVVVAVEEEEEDDDVVVVVTVAVSDSSTAVEVTIESSPELVALSTPEDVTASVSPSPESTIPGHNDDGPVPARKATMMFWPVTSRSPHARCTRGTRASSASMQPLLHPSDPKSAGAQSSMAVVYSVSQPVGRSSARGVKSARVTAATRVAGERRRRWRRLWWWRRGVDADLGVNISEGDGEGLRNGEVGFGGMVS
jgi:hypothetical protein